MNNLIFQKLKNLPSSPGVYIFYAKGVSASGGKDKNGAVLYVGKAGSLKDRVGSYFKYNANTRMNANGTNMQMGSRPIEIMIHEVVDFEVKKTDTVLEAYIMEQDLIKRLQPKHNVSGKDDKSFVYLFLTKEEFPRWMIIRKTDISQISDSKFVMVERSPNISYSIPYSKLYGPYTSRRNVELVLKIMRKIFPYHNRPQKTEKECLDYQIGLCPGPYDNAISKEDYAKNIRGIRMILEGKKKGLINKMKKEMEEYSQRREYEKAAETRNQLFALQHIRDIALLSNKESMNDGERELRLEGYDISNISGKYAVGSMVVFDNAGGAFEANKSQYRKFKIKTIEGANDVGAMEEVLMRRFRNNWPRPNLIILDGGAGYLNMARKVLRIYRLDIPLLAVAKGPTRKKTDLRYFGTIPDIPRKIIEQVRDEAHRFAVTYHRKVRSRETIR